MAAEAGPASAAAEPGPASGPVAPAGFNVEFVDAYLKNILPCVAYIKTPDGHGSGFFYCPNPQDVEPHCKANRWPRVWVVVTARHVIEGESIQNIEIRSARGVRLYPIQLSRMYEFDARFILCVELEGQEAFLNYLEPSTLYERTLLRLDQIFLLGFPSEISPLGYGSVASFPATIICEEAPIVSIVGKVAVRCRAVVAGITSGPGTSGGPVIRINEGRSDHLTSSHLSCQVVGIVVAGADNIGEHTMTYILPVRQFLRPLHAFCGDIIANYFALNETTGLRELRLDLIHRLHESVRAARRRPNRFCVSLFATNAAASMSSAEVEIDDEGNCCWVARNGVPMSCKIRDATEEPLPEVKEKKHFTENELQYLSHIIPSDMAPNKPKTQKRKKKGRR